METIGHKNIKKLVQSGDLDKRENQLSELLKAAGLGTDLKEIIGHPVLIQSLSHLRYWEVAATTVLSVATDIREIRRAKK